MSKKRSNGEGSISFDKTRGSYRAAITAPDGRRIYKRFKTEQEALVWKTGQINDMHKGNFVAPNDITIGRWVVEWLETYKKGSVKQRTYERYTSLAKHLIRIADVKLQDLKPMQVQKLYQELPALSPCTIHKVHKLLKDMITKAYELDMIQKNIMLPVKAPKFEKKEIEIFSRSEIEKILKVVHDEPRFKKYYPAILLAATTGIRIGELLGLRWCDVLIATTEIYIRKSLQESSILGMMLDTPKTKASIRKIKVTEEAIRELIALKNSVGSIDIKQEQLCFLTRNQTPISPHNFERVWRKVIEAAGIPYKNFHVLRHTHATELLASGVPIVEVSRRLGHSKIGHTLELYGHAIPNYDDKIVNKIQQLYSLP